jgi:DNA-binding HxlR family transcriptional regulator
MTEETLDKIDQKLVKCVEEFSGERVDYIIKILDCITSKTLRDRLDVLDSQGDIILDRKAYRGQVIAKITPLGKETIVRWAQEPASSEVNS